MKRRRTGLTLGQQLLMLGLLAVILLLAITAVYYAGSTEILTNRSTEYFSIIFSLVESQVNAIISNTELVMQSLENNSMVEKYLQSGSPEQATFVRNLLMETVMHATKYDPEHDSDNVIEAICLLRGEEYLKALSGDLSDVFHAVVSDYNLEQQIYHTVNYTRLYYSEAREAYYYAIIQPLEYRLADASPYSRKVAYCVYLCNASRMQRRLFSAAIPNNAMLYLYDYDHRIVAASDRSLMGESLVNTLDANISLNKLSSNTQELYCNGEKTLCRLANLSTTEWKLLLLIPYNGLTSDLKQLLHYGVGLCGVLLCVAFLFVFYVIRRNMRDLRVIVDGLQSVETLNNHYRLPDNRTVEFNTITQSINRMLEQLELTTEEALEMKERIFSNEILKKNAELYALQTQINPHFLYNTLGCICSIAQHYQIKEIETIANSMAKIFRYCIKREASVPLSEELNCVLEYLEIIKQRFPNRMQFFICIPETHLQHPIPKMTLQPVVENAIQHGLRNVNRSGILSISSEETEDGFRIVVRDNGAGIAPETYARLQESLARGSQAAIHEQNDCIGLMNIHARLQLELGTKYGLGVFSEFGKGTTVILNMPRSEAQSAETKEGTTAETPARLETGER